jgi:cytochrome c
MKGQHMKTLIVTFALLSSSLAWASADLAARKNCLGCHAVEAKRVGPAYKAVAARYAGQTGAAEKLAETVLRGGVGAWGAIPMPANAVSPEEARQLVAWILSQR